MAEAKTSYGLGAIVWTLGVLVSLTACGAAMIGGVWAGIGGAALGVIITGVCGQLAVGRIAQFGKTVETALEQGRLEGLMESAGGDSLGRVQSLVAQKLYAAQKRETLFSQAIRSLGAAMVVCDRQGQVVEASKGLLRLLGRSETDVIGKSCRDAVFGGRAVASDASGPAETVVELAGGKSLDAVLASDSIRDAKGAVVGTVTAFVEVAETKRKLEEMEKGQAALMASGGSISEVAQRVASASEELSASADEQARGAKQQKERADSVATAMEEMTATVIEVAQNASATSEAADVAQTSARDGVDLVSRSVAGINNVAESASKLSGVLSQLDHQSGEIGRIINVINDIADQTNLLALNAAIEAARAGEAGRGFAVVADEVRKLAEKTMTATKEVEEAIRTIQLRSQDAMKSMTETERQVQESTELANQTGEALRQIMSRIEDMVMRVSQIATAAEEQSAAAEEINRSIEDIANISREADDGAEQAAAATRELADLSQELLTLAIGLSGRGAENTKLWKSEGQMRGVLPSLMQEFVRTTYGEGPYRTMQRALGDPVFLPTANYPDQVLKQMAQVVGEAAGKSSREVFLGFGRFTAPKFKKMYGRYFKASSAKELFLKIDSIHTQLTKDYPGIHPPKFEYDEHGDTLIMTYRSKRGLFDYFEGILLGAAEFFGQKAAIRVTKIDSKSAKAEIRFK